MRHVAVVLLGSAIVPAALFASAGRLDWPMAWAYTVVFLLGVYGSRTVIALKHPGLLAERGRAVDRRDVGDADRILLLLISLVGPILISVVAGLDERFGWQPELPLGAQIGGLVAVALGHAFATWAVAVNRFFTSVVRIQTKLGHSVVSTGPYRLIRHPGYAGFVAYALFSPPALGSLWALVPAALLAFCVAARTVLEERRLREGLPGYAEYASRVHYRWLPGIW